MQLKDGTLLTNVPGTCSKHCENCFHSGCYAVNSARLHSNVVIKAWGENTLLLRKGIIWDKIDSYINKNQKKIKLWRINVSGEIGSVQEFEKWNNIAAKYPQIQFGLYTKNYEDLDLFMQKHGKTADNFVINVSQWEHCADNFLAKYPNVFNVFEYNPTNMKNCTWSDSEKKRINSLPKCPAVDIKGHHTKDVHGNPITCDKCLRCYRKTGQTTTVWSH